MIRFRVVLAVTVAFARISPATGTAVDRTEAEHPRFPRLETQALDRSMAILPDSAAGSVTLLGFAFRMALQRDMSSWLLPYMEEFSDDRRFLAYEVPMMGTSVAVRLLRATIDRSMRRSIPKHLHRFILPVYRDYRDFAAKMDMLDHSAVHMFLLDREGHIRWRTTGPPGDEDLAALFVLARELADEPRRVH